MPGPAARQDDLLRRAVTVGLVVVALGAVVGVALAVLARQPGPGQSAAPAAPTPAGVAAGAGDAAPAQSTITTAAPTTTVTTTTTSTTTTTPPPVELEGEGYQASAGVQPAFKDQASGGATMGYIENGDWAAYPGVPLLVPMTVTARVSSATSGGTIEFRDGVTLGPLLGSVEVPGTGDWASFTTVSAGLAPGATGTLVLRFTGGGGYLLDVDSLEVAAAG